MPDRRRLGGALQGLGEGLALLGKSRMERNIREKEQTQSQQETRLNQLLNDFDTSARAISTPEHVGKVGADVAQQEYANLKRRLPKGVEGLIGQDPNFASLDTTVGEREGGLLKDLGGITSPDDPRLTPGGATRMAEGARVPTAVSFPMLGSSPNSDMSNPDPEFEKILEMVKGQKEGMLAKEPTEEQKNPLTGQSTFTTARQRNVPGFTTKTGLTAEEQASADAKKKQAELDVTNNPTNQAGTARGAGLTAGAQKRAELAAELEQMGITGQQQTGALQLADDFEKASSDYFTIRGAMKATQGLAQQRTGQGDTGIIFNYMKALDPNSSVREGEAAMVQNAASIPSRIREAYNKALSGEKLDDTVRNEILQSMRVLYTSAEQDHKDRVKLFTERAARLRVPASLVIREPSALPETAPDTSESPLARARRAAGAH